MHVLKTMHRQFSWIYVQCHEAQQRAYCGDMRIYNFERTTCVCAAHKQLTTEQLRDADGCARDEQVELGNELESVDVPDLATAALALSNRLVALAKCIGLASKESEEERRRVMRSWIGRSL